MNDITKIEQSAAAKKETMMGVYPDIPNEAYHSGPGVSKSGLWTIYNQTPAHYKFPAARPDNSTTFDFGSATHIAILEPEKFETSVMKGPDDRRGNNWKHAVAEGVNSNRIVLTSGDYDEVLTIRDAAHSNSRISSIITGGKPEVEHSGYWTDGGTGELCRCRPDLYRPDLSLMLDLKTSHSASPEEFARSVINYGYHAQEAFYSDGYNSLGKPVEAFVFLAWEKKSPYAFALYELPPSIVEEGRAIMRSALSRYSECLKSDRWPAFGEDVTELNFKPWSYRETEAPRMEEEQAA